MRRILVSAAVLAAATIVGVVGARHHATASPSPTAPGVYVVGGVGSGAQADRFSLATILGDPASITPAQQIGQPGGTFAAAAVTADASSVVLLRQGSGGDVVTVLRVASGAVTGSVTVPGTGGGEVAADPANPDQAYVAAGGALSRVGTGAGAGAATVTPVASLSFTAQALSVSPDGKTAYVGGLDPSSGADVVDEVPLGAGANQMWSQPPPAGDKNGVNDVALSPDGQHLFAVDGVGVFELGLPLAATAAAKTEVAMVGMQAVTVSPDGATVYAGGVDGTSQAYLVSFPAGAPATTTVRDLQGAAGGVSLGVSPDGGNLVAAVGSTGASGVPATSLYPTPLSRGTLQTPGRAMALPAGLGLAGSPAGVAITPDQAPAATLAAQGQPAGTATAFDASKSTVAFGTISSYRWSFGDGATATTTGPTISHTYAKAGTFSAGVVETDSAGTSVAPAVSGTSLTVDSSGRTPFRQAAPSAAATLAVVVGSAAASTPSSPTTSAGAVSNPQLILRPNVGPPGTIVSVTGAGFPANTPLTIFWSVSTGSSVVTTDANGGLSTQLAILVPDVLGPRSAEASSVPSASASFLVVPADAEPGGGDATPVFRSDDS